jgi:hypothetical protein
MMTTLQRAAILRARRILRAATLRAAARHVDADDLHLAIEALDAAICDAGPGLDPLRPSRAEAQDAEPGRAAVQPPDLIQTSIAAFLTSPAGRRTLRTLLAEERATPVTEPKE